MPFVAPLFAFGDSVIDAFNPTTWAFEGSIDVNPGAGNAPGGLWSMTFGGDGSGADAGWARSGEAAGVGNICFSKTGSSAIVLRVITRKSLN